MSLSVIIPTLGEEQPVVATLAALVPGAAAGLIREVLLVDTSQSDAIAHIADVAGCNFLAIKGARADALAAGAGAARSDWLMFLHPGAVLDTGWIDETAQFIQSVATSGRPRAGIFRYARAPYSENSLRQTLRSVGRALSGPSADQGLLIARSHYERLGGHARGTRRAEARLLSHLGRSGRALLRTRIYVAAG
ncbi:glycosyltransferase [Bradyrhizobium sp. WD16]|uniref:glycosyltransferase n=1 Tax=Bradyrhizobium sp. WD16 TaxID=1521768 RepID=UPI0020A5142F|nr:glycosyltransferase [Bradyrhizobium sp. WD16]